MPGLGVSNISSYDPNLFVAYALYTAYAYKGSMGKDILSKRGDLLFAVRGTARIKGRTPEFHVPFHAWTTGKENGQRGRNRLPTRGVWGG